MQKLTRVVRNGIIYVSTVVLVGSPSVAVYAEDSTDYYDPATGKWNNSKWIYNPETKVYEPAPVAQPSPSPTPSSSPAPAQSTDNSGTPAAEGSADNSAADSSVTNGGPSSNNQINQDTDESSDVTINNGTQIKNGLDSDATSGEAGVKQNTKGGNAQTGNASADATIVNSVHSTVGSGENTGIARFTIDLYGDVNGDIVVGPTMGNAEIDKSTKINSDTNINNNDSITNDIDLSAKSGNAQVTGNTTAGSAQSGDARAVANLLNLVNTVIAANKSFVGTINIHGNLNGDILISPEFIPQLLGSNGNAKVEESFNMPLTTNINDDQTIVNNVDLKATSGTASVKDNTSAGTAQSGDAQTDLQILNLTGHEVVAENSVLVFVNVKGKWVGMILDAPNSTAAAFGSGVVKHDTTLASNTNINNKAAITNNINVTAVSGDATVSSNTVGGDAKTGNANASANIANISNSKFSLSGWFAVLYINIDGDWTGWALKDTEAGNMIAQAAPIAASMPPAPKVGTPNVRLGYVPRANGSVSQVMDQTSGMNKGDPYAQAVLASATNDILGEKTEQPARLVQSMSPREDPFSLIMMIGGFGIASASGIVWVVRRLLGF